MLTARTRLWIVFAFIACTAVLSAQQRPPRDPGVVASGPPVRDGRIETGTGAIAGRIVHHGDETTPVRRAIVALASANITQRTAVTDDEGRFEFAGLTAGRYTLRFNKASYVTTMYGAERTRGQGLTIALADGERVADLVGTIMRGNVATGRIIDVHGRPVIGASVAVYERVTVGGRTTYRPGRAGFQTTDDRGVYRVYGFEPGEWTVAVRSMSALTSRTMRAPTAEELRWAFERRSQPGSVGASATPGPPSGRPVRPASVYYPGVQNAAAATFLSFGIGEEKSGLDIVLPMVSTYSVSGRVTRLDGGPTTTTQIMALMKVPTGASPQLINIRPAQSGSDGTYTIEGLEPGDYTLTARGMSGPITIREGAGPGGLPLPSGPDLWAMQDLFISTVDHTNVNLTLRPALAVSGRVVFESASNTPPPDPTRVRISMRSPPGESPGFGSGTSGVADDGSFTFQSLVPGRYLLVANVSDATWVVKSAMAGDKNVLDEALEITPAGVGPPIEVTFTDRKTELTGTLLDREGRPAPELSVIVFGADPAQWRQGSRWVRMPTRPASDGRFTISGLPPGEYYFAALAQFDDQEWYTPEFLERVAPGAITITLVEGETTRQDVKLQ